MKAVANMSLPEITAPEAIHLLLTEFVQAFQAALGDTLTGIYLHGSLAMGGFNPLTSDVDILVVVSDPLNETVKRHLGQILLRLSTLTPTNGLEMSVLALPALRSFKHPCPYELHFSNGNKADYINDHIDFTHALYDPDLAAHIVITRARGLCLYGKPIDRVFPKIPPSDYLDSITGDADWSYAKIMQGPHSGEGWVPAYGVLNACRILAFVEQGLITSKLEGGLWGIEHLPVQYRPVIQAALNEYRSTGVKYTVDLKLLKQFATFSIEAIHRSTAARQSGCFALRRRAGGKSVDSPQHTNPDEDRIK